MPIGLLVPFFFSSASTAKYPLAVTGRGTVSDSAYPPEAVRPTGRLSRTVCRGMPWTVSTDT